MKMFGATLNTKPNMIGPFDNCKADITQKPDEIHEHFGPRVVAILRNLKCDAR